MVARDFLLVPTPFSPHALPPWQDAPDPRRIPLKMNETSFSADGSFIILRDPNARQASSFRENLKQ
jgi:hypothetical protein